MRAALYARYSTALQSGASVEDQFRLLRQRALRESWVLAGEHADRAISGTVRDRPGLAAAMGQIERGEADVLLAESLDRLSRDQEDIANIFKRVRFARARIVTLAEGEIGTLHIGMGGTIAAIYVEQLAEKTRRGQIGRVEAGRIPGGLSYGYRPVRQLDAKGEPERGLREIDPAQAAVIRRIFADYADGKSPIAIAADLNARGEPSPRGGLWRASTILGHRQRRNGILNNELYRGLIVYNRQSFRKDPETRKRISRPNAEADVVETEAPALRIVDEELWSRVRTRIESHAGKPAAQARRPRRLLSGMMSCGICGGAYVIVGSDRWGCSNARQTGTCSNRTTLFNRQAEKRIWAALENHLLHSDVIAGYFDELRLLVAEERRRRIAGRATIERRLAELERDNDRIVDAIVKGAPAENFVRRMQEIATARTAITEELEELPQADALPPIHPGTITHYRRRIAQLHELVDGDEALRHTGRALLSELIQKIEVTPRTGRTGADLTVHGQLAAFLQLAAGEPTQNRMLPMVAGAGFEPATFRL